MRRLLYITILLIQSALLHGQSGYYMTDSVIYLGVNIKDRGAIQNSRECKIEGKSQTLIFSPAKVTAYRLNDGRLYLSKVININNKENRVFLELMSKGKLNLFFYKSAEESRFFIEKDSGQLVDLPKKSNEKMIYRDILKSNVLDCGYASDAVSLVSYNKSSLTRFTDKYNSCSEKPFTFLRYGLTAGYGFAKPTNWGIEDKILKEAVFKADSYFSIGLFMDIPVYRSNFSVHPEIYYQKNAFSGHLDDNNIAYDCIINSTSISLPVSIRYTYPSVKFRPYFNLGATFGYNIRNNNAAYSTTTDNDTINIEELNYGTIYSDIMIGYMAGAGVECKVDRRRSLFIELRFNNLFPTDREVYGNMSFQSLIGINF
jgi:hypothetical protein